MADLVTGLTPLRISIGYSLLHSALATAGLLCVNPKLEGLGNWLRQTRREIPTILQGCELYAAVIVEQSGISQPAVSRHLNLLAVAGVLQVRKAGKARCCGADDGVLKLQADALRAPA